MASAARSIVVGIAALALLTGCAPDAEVPAPSSPAPTPSATATPTPTPSATPTPTPTPAPTASAVPTASPEADWPRCADAIVIDPEGAYTVGWEGTYEQQIAASAPRPGFEPADLLDSDGVLCAVTYDYPADGPGAGVGRFSTAIVRDADVVPAVQAWAAEHGYEPLEPEAEGPEYVQRDGDVFSARLAVAPIGEPLYGDEPQLDALERRSGLDLQPTDVLLTHVTFGAPSE
ncbi:MAG: hypothetical protein ACQEWM_00795 [Actinomycetota bacterium]